MNSLRILGPVSDAIDTLLAAHWTIGQVTISVGRTLGFAVAVWIAIFASRVTQVLLRDDVLPRFALPRGVPNAISTVANYAMVLIGLLIGAAILGIELSNLTLIVGALGVGIGFGLQNVVNNLVSGFILIFERSVQIGDTVQVSDLHGQRDADRSARQPVAHGQRFRSDRSERRADLESPDQLDTVRPPAPARSRGRRRVWQRPGDRYIRFFGACSTPRRR